LKNDFQTSSSASAVKPIIGGLQRSFQPSTATRWMISRNAGNARTKMASDVLDGVSDVSASLEDQASRRRTLLEGTADTVHVDEQDMIRWSRELS
jgi:hypothetical protein